MRSIVNGILSYGLMNVPVGVCSAAQKKEITFKTVHKECGTPVNQVKRCATCDRIVQTEEIGKAFEYVKKQFLPMDEEELVQLAAERSKVITINKFVAWEDIDELQAEKHYYLAPSEILTRPYTLLSNAMGEKKAVGIGTQSLFGKEHPSMVWAKEGGALVLSCLFCYDEMVSDDEIQESLGLVPDEEQELANEFVALMMRPLNPPEDFVSDSRRRLNEFIEAKLNGVSVEFKEAEEAPAVTVDIMAQLQASVLAAREAA